MARARDLGGAPVTERFPLAPMDAPMRAMTWICCAIPVVLVGFGVRIWPPVGGVLLGTGVFVLALYAFVGLWLRPRAFVVTPDAIEIEWPVRRRRINRAAIEEVRILDRDERRSELGTLIRIGAGGLWGAFGLARTSQGLHELWVSRLDRMVWIRCKARRSLLVTPADAERFVEILRRRAA